MIPFFRKIRKQLAADNKPKKYLRYAIGEILLVVIGILVALQINNWNDNRKKEEQFESLLEQIYNIIDVDMENFHNFNINYMKQQALINSIIQNIDSVPSNKLIHILFYLDAHIKNYTSEANALLPFIEFNPSNKEQSVIVKQITSYATIKTLQIETKPRLKPLLIKANIPVPDIALGLMAANNFERVDTLFYSKSEIQKVKELVKTSSFQVSLRSLFASKQFPITAFTNEINNSNSILKLIRNYKPDVQLLYDDIGILGTAINGYTVSSIPMKLTNIQGSIWEIDIQLKDGDVKFRNRDSWESNWGGIDFPKGKTNSFGDNIPVKKGNYHVILNLNAKTYEFIKND